jgi:NAD+ synthase
VTADLDAIRRVVVEGLRRVVRGAGYRRGVIGLTGRVEEVVVAALAAEALNAAQVRTVVLACPVHGGGDRARAAAGHLGVACEEVALDPWLDRLLEDAPEASPVRRRGFLCRLRTALLHDRAAAHRGLVLGTASKSERLLGRDALFGEHACAVAPIGDLYATEVRALATAYGIPDEIAGPEPEIALPESSVQGGSFEPTWAWIDPLLRHLHDGRLRRHQLTRMGYEKPDIHRVAAAMRRSRFKRKPPTVIVVSSRPV